jgi:hypothetical protein
MSGRRMATAQRDAINPVAPLAAAGPTQENPVEPAAARQIASRSITFRQITWGALGCPTESGVYCADHDGMQTNLEIHVKLIHIIAAEDNPAAVFTVIALHPPVGPPQLVLGHRTD